MTWAPFEYREFYDVPRSILVRRGYTYYYLESRFDEELDDYTDRYEVYRLPADFAPASVGPSWVHLATIGTRLGGLPVADVQFDDTRRRLIDIDVLDQVTGHGAR